MKTLTLISALLFCSPAIACEPQQPQTYLVYRRPAPVVQALGFTARAVTWPFRPTYYFVPVGPIR